MASKILVPGIIAGIVILIVSMIISTITQSVWKYDVLKLDGMRSATTDPIMALFFVFPWVIGFAIAILYDYTKSAFKGTTTQKGISLGLLGWIVYAIPSAFLVFTSMNYPIGFTVNSIIGPLAYMTAAGITITKLGEKKWPANNM